MKYITSMRTVLFISYEGTDFCGWQEQSGLNTVEGSLRRAIQLALGAEVEMAVAGRTDAGVHGYQQCVHVDQLSGKTWQKLPEKAWLRGVNDRLPPSIRIEKVLPAPAGFHARHSAQGRRYRYCILNQAQISPFLSRYFYHYALAMDIPKMQAACRPFLGEHDFSSFRGAFCQAFSPIRRIRLLEVSTDGNRVFIDVEGNGFLHNMIRIIAGTLLDVACNRREPETIAELIQAKNRTLAGPTLPPQGLYFCGALYPEAFGLPCYKIPFSEDEV